MKDTKQQWWLSWVSGRGTYQESKFEADAELVVEHYRNEGYVTARVGQPELKYIEDSADMKTRWVQLRIPVDEGKRYRVGEFKFEGNTVVKTEALRPLFKMKEGDFYNEKRVRKGLESARELYGTGGYFEFTAFPELIPRDVDENGQPRKDLPPGTPPLVDVTMRVQEGAQYFVNRITFVGNTTTRDNVIRREMRLVENGVFNTEALKFSVRRLNQLGYFKSLEDQGINVEKTPNAENKVDVTLKLEEQNRNQLTFGAGVSQFEGVFGQLSFQTANFLGRGETFSIAVQAGERAQNYQLSFSEPFLFDRAITGGIDLYKREIRYISQFSQASKGGNLIFGFPVADFTRMFVNYSYEQVQVGDLSELFLDPDVIRRNPFLQDLSSRTISKIAPSLVHNTVDNPIFPNTGRRLTATVDLAGLGGNTNFWNPRLEGVFYFQQSPRLTLGFRGQFEYIAPLGSTVWEDPNCGTSGFEGSCLPIFERLFLGGEYNIRGFDIRSIGPMTETGLVIGGDKSLLFNAEYQISIANPVRLVFFYDTGQVRDKGQAFAFNEFKTSTGAEVRFFMPVLNVPFRLIMAYNPQRAGVLDNNLLPTKEFTFRFAVGSTF
jgi:outer membrane protein insertion porin family